MKRSSPGLTWGAVEKRDLVLGVVVPGIVLAPFLLLGLLGILVTVLSRRPLPAEGRALVPLFVLAGLVALAFLGAIASVIGSGADRVRQNGPRRLATALVLAAGLVVCLGALVAQVPSLRWALRGRENASSLLLLVPGVLVLLGPLLVGAKCFLAVVRPLGGAHHGEH